MAGSPRFFYTDVTNDVLFGCKGPCHGGGVDELGQSGAGNRSRIDPERAIEVSRRAGIQWGAIGHEQLLRLGLSRSAILRSVKSGRLHERYPGVYTVGHTSLPIEGELVAALLAAGPGAVLSHATAAWWWSLIPAPPAVIEVSVPHGRRTRVDGVKIHRRRRFDTTRHRRFPITTGIQTLLDYASGHSIAEVKRALAQAEYHHQFDVERLRPALGRGRPGAATLRQAVALHQPELARTRSWLEAVFLELCQELGLPTPLTNELFHGFLIDAMWRDRRLAVELDGLQGHRTRAQLERDHERDLMLRRHGFVVLRYTAHQLKYQRAEVAADLLQAYNARN